MSLEARTTSPDRSLASLLKHPRRKKVPTAESSAASLATNDSEVEKGGFLRASIDKIRDHRQNSDNDGRRSSFDPSRRLSKLVSSRKRRKSVQVGESAQAEHLTDVHGLGISSNNHSAESLTNRAASISSSLLTDDEDPDPFVRPLLDTRPSHAGYLTLSSPLIAAKTVNASAPIAEEIESSHSTTWPAPPPLDSYLADQEPPRDSNHAIASLPRISSPLRLDNTIPTHTLPHLAISPVSVLDPPATFVTPPTPDIPQESSFDTIPRKKLGSRLTLGSLPPKSNPSSPSQPLQDPAPYHRRVRSTTGAGRVFNPLTPAIEEAKTPGGSLIQPPGSSGFFNSVFSATQNAVSQLSSTFSTTSSPAGLRVRSGSGVGLAERLGFSGGEEVLPPNSIQSVDGTLIAESEPTIATLGLGNLSFSHLGLSEANADADPMPPKDNLLVERRKRAPSIIQNGGVPNKKEEASAARAISAAYSDKPASEKAPSVDSDAIGGGRPHSIASAIGSIADTTPPASIANGVEGSINRRSNSVRSRLSERRRRNRNGSVAAGSTIGVNHGVLANASKSRPTGFAVASSKRNKDFHGFFKSVPEDDYLVEDYSAALQRDILLQGRLYVSEKHICFSSNILGWVTNLVISFDEVVAMEKKMTAVIFPNAIVVHTQNAKHTFASLIGREATYDLMLAVWKAAGHANIKATEHGHALEGTTTGEKMGTDDLSDTSDDTSEEFYDEDEDVDGASSFMAADASDTESESVDVSKPKNASPGPPSTHANGKAGDAAAATIGGAGATGEIPGPTTHTPTECSDGDTHYEKSLVDTTIPAPLGKIYSMMFGPQSGVVMRKFLIDDQKSGDVQYEDDKKGLGEEQKTFSYSFIKPLGGAIGPRQTKCMVTQSLDAFDLEKAVSVTCSTQTPDVPSGNVFVTKTKYCLMWGPANSTRLLMNCTVEWSGKSWIKGPIEKGANDGQEKYGKDIVAFFKSYVTKAPGRAGTVKSAKGKARRKKSSGDAYAGDGGSGGDKMAPGAASSNRSWGVLEPLHAVLSPLADVAGPLTNSTMVLGVMAFVVIVLLLRQTYHRRSDAASGSQKGVASVGAQRLAAYEELWRREESDLWSWLEDRVGLDAAGGVLSSSESVSQRPVKRRLEGEGASEREVQEAIRVTEEKLKKLKEVVEGKREKERGKGGGSVGAGKA